LDKNILSKNIRNIKKIIDESCWFFSKGDEDIARFKEKGVIQ